MAAPEPRVVQDNTRQSRTDSRASTTVVTPGGSDITEVIEAAVTTTRTTPANTVEQERVTAAYNVESERITAAHVIESARVTAAHNISSERITAAHTVTGTRVTASHSITGTKTVPSHTVTTTNQESKGYSMQFKIIFQARNPVPPLDAVIPDPCA